MARTSLLFLLGSLLIVAPCAHAGEWVVDHYERNGVFHSQFLDSSQPLPSGEPAATLVQKHELRVVWTPEGEKSYSDGVLLKRSVPSGSPDAPKLMLYRGVLASSFSRAQQVVLVGSAAGLAKATYNVRAVLRWQRNRVQERENGPLVDDPKDDPPKYFWLAENAAIRATGGDGFKFSQILSPFATSASVSPASKSTYPLDIVQQRLICVTARGGKAIVPTARFGLQVALSSATPKQLADIFRSDSQFLYSVSPVRFEILARLKEDNYPADLFTGYQLPEEKGATGHYASSTDIAAGHMINSEHIHEADLALRVLDSEGQPLAHIEVPYLPRLSVINGQGVKKSAALMPTDAPQIGYTDDAGRIALARLLSSDSINPPNKPVAVQFRDALDAGAKIGG